MDTFYWDALYGSQNLSLNDFDVLTEFDGEAWRELHLYKLPEFIKVLEGCNHLQNIQQSAEKKHTRNETS